MRKWNKMTYLRKCLEEVTHIRIEMTQLNDEEEELEVAMRKCIRKEPMTQREKDLVSAWVMEMQEDEQ